MFARSDVADVVVSLDKNLSLALGEDRAMGLVGHRNKKSKLAFGPQVLPFVEQTKIQKTSQQL